jgi:4'-phosphopantetheinyl transferase N-terminal domain
VIERLVPDTIATAETRENLLNVKLFPEEERSLGRAIAKRRQEFVTGRACARIAKCTLNVHCAESTNPNMRTVKLDATRPEPHPRRAHRTAPHRPCTRSRQSQSQHQPSAANQSAPVARARIPSSHRAP